LLVGAKVPGSESSTPGTFAPGSEWSWERKVHNSSATAIVSITFRREPKRRYINFGELVVGELDCQRVGLSASCP